MSDLKIVPGKSDIETANDIRTEITEQLRALCSIMDSAKTAGFVVSFQLGVDYRGLNTIGSLTIAKHF